MKPVRRICFISHFAYPIIASKGRTVTGGAELQQYLLGKQLLHLGNEVFFVCGNFGQKKIEIIDGLVVYRCNKKGLRRILQVVPLWRTLYQIRPDIIYARCMTFNACLAAIYSKFATNKFVFAAGSDYDFALNRNALKWLKLSKWPWPLLIRWALNSADQLVAQTDNQAYIAENAVGRIPIVIPNCVLTVQTSNEVVCSQVVWLANFHRHKQPKKVLQIAQRSPGLNFVLIGAKRNEYYYKEVLEFANKLPNVKILGPLNHDHACEIVSKSLALLNTSDQCVEGFPNTFLEAWVRGVPVVTLHADPDNIIKNENLGFFCDGCLDNAVKSLNILATDRKLREQIRQRLVRFARERFSVDSVTSKLCEVFKCL